MAVAPALEDSAPGNNFRKTLPGALSSNEGLDSPVSMQTTNLNLHGSRWQALLPLMVLHCHMVVVVVVAVVAVAPALEDSAPGNNFRKILPGALSLNEGLD